MSGLDGTLKSEHCKQEQHKFDNHTSMDGKGELISFIEGGEVEKFLSIPKLSF